MLDTPRQQLERRSRAKRASLGRKIEQLDTRVEVAMVATGRKVKSAGITMIVVLAAAVIGTFAILIRQWRAQTRRSRRRS